jgi:transcriptional regulator with XRE-family HTH domain
LVSNSVRINSADESGWSGRVSDFGSPAARQRRLASELRRLRRAARLTGREVATRLGWSEAKLSRIENGQTRVKIADFDHFMGLYGVSGPQRAELVALATESRETGPVEELGGHLPHGHTEILRLESEAQAMSTWEPQVVPGLLQLEDYTRSLLQVWPRVLVRPAAEVERRVKTSQLRQRVLTRAPPLDLSFVIDESVLMRGFAAAAVMSAQLLHLAEVSEHPNIEVRILALSGGQVIGTGAFVCFSFPQVHGVSLPDSIAIEHLLGTTVVTSEAEVNTYQVVFKTLRDSSLNSRSSRDKLVRAAREIWQ